MHCIFLTSSIDDDGEASDNSNLRNYINDYANACVTSDDDDDEEEDEEPGTSAREWCLHSFRIYWDNNLYLMFN